ncbi:hypothetical protein HJ590_08590 [Naumannella sp. ID2617S]|nr:hypothetical protein [Naumannella sp. ID2617S]
MTLSQLGLLSSIISIVFLVLGLAVVVFGVIKTTGITRTLLVVAGGLMVFERLLFLVYPFLLKGGGRDALVVAPTLIGGVIGLAITVCMVLAAVRAGEQRAAARSPQDPGPSQSYPQAPQQQSQAYPQRNQQQWPPQQYPN